jgi:hypothetical protein
MTSLTIEDGITPLTIEDDVTPLTLEDDGDTIGRPTLKIEVAFTSNPLDANQWWVDITDWVKSIATNTGRQQEVDDFQAGTVSLVLDNSDRRFDPLHTTGPYYGWLKPRRRIRITATLGPVTYPLYTGFVDGWPQTSFRPPESAETSVTATDLFVILNNIELPRSVYAIEVDADNPSMWYGLGEDTGIVVRDLSGNEIDATYNFEPTARIAQTLVFGEPTGSVKMPAWTDASADIRPAMLVRRNPAGTPIESYPHTLELWFQPDTRNPQINAGATSLDALVVTAIANTRISRITLSFQESTGKWAIAAETDTGPAGSGTIRYTPGAPGSGTNAVYDFTRAPHHVVAVISSATSITMYLDGVSVGTLATGAGGGLVNDDTFLTVGGYRPEAVAQDATVFIDEFSAYQASLSSGRVTAHYTAGTAPWTGEKTGTRVHRILGAAGLLLGDRDVDTGMVTLGSTALATDCLSYLKSMESTEDGQLYVAHQEGGAVRFRDANDLVTDRRRTTQQAVFSDRPDFTAAIWGTSTWGSGVWGSSRVVRYQPENLRFELSEQFIYNDVSVSWDAGTETWADADSIVAYGRRDRSLSTRLATAGEAKLRAIELVERYKEPRIQVSGISVDLAGTKTTAEQETVLGLRIGDRVAVRLHPQSIGSALEIEAYIEGISDQIDNGVNQWQRSFNLSLAI